MDNKFLNKLSTFLFYISILIFIIAFNFTDNPTGGWYQQFMPNLNGRALTDITFLDSLTGFAVTDGNSTNDGYILKTSNGGDNWIIKHSQNVKFNKVQFINSTTGFVNAYVNLLFKTTNSGENWFTINLPSDLFSDDMWVLNEDTIWLAQINDLVGGLFRTTNGGQAWIRQYYQFGNQPNKIYMFNSNIGFMFNQNDSLFKTTNSGTNWFRIPGGAFTDICFVDSLTGWKIFSFDIKKTTDGGFTWFEQSLPRIQGQLLSGVLGLDILNQDSLWASGVILINKNDFKGVVFKTTNGGLNWGFQMPDTILNIQQYDYINIVDKRNIWTYSINFGFHTTTGGNDSTYYLTSINPIVAAIPSNYKLYQNYPNPFNPLTKIRYEIKVESFVKLSVFSIQGKEIKSIVNERQNAGVYEADFSVTEYGLSLSSGVYFYSLIADDKIVDTKKMIVVK